MKARKKAGGGEIFFGAGEGRGTGFGWASAGSDPPLLGLSGVLTGDGMPPDIRDSKSRARRSRRPVGEIF
jgi:hypothetical protein